MAVKSLQSRGMSAEPHTDPRRWLFTGGSGRVGRMMLRYWQDVPPSAQIVAPLRGAAGAGALVWDPVLGPIPIPASAQPGGFSCLIAFAGITPMTGQALEGNALLAEATLKAAFAASIPRVLLTSSSAVYGMPQGNTAFNEDAPRVPCNPYGAAKAAMERVCDAWRARGLEICVLRIGNVAGADALILNGQKAGGGSPLQIDQFADGHGPRRSYIGAASLARVVESLAWSGAVLPQVLNIAAPGPVDMVDLAQAAGMPWMWRAAPQAAVQHITLDPARLSALHAFDPAESDPVEMVRQWHQLKDMQ